MLCVDKNNTTIGITDIVVSFPIPYQNYLDDFCFVVTGKSKEQLESEGVEIVVQ